MKANELMIGDWVTGKKWRENPFKLARLNDKGKYCYGITSDGAQVGPFLIEEIEPIPLTQEILEKNGFEKQLGNFVYENDDESLRIEFYPKNINYTNCCYDYIDIERGCVTITEKPIEFVHELQHALRLCGIYKEFEL